jgi:hypothetical protein
MEFTPIGPVKPARKVDTLRRNIKDVVDRCKKSTVDECDGKISELAAALAADSEWNLFIAKASKS